MGYQSKQNTTKFTDSCLAWKGHEHSRPLTETHPKEHSFADSPKDSWSIANKYLIFCYVPNSSELDALKFGRIFSINEREVNVSFY